MIGHCKTRVHTSTANPGHPGRVHRIFEDWKSAKVSAGV